MTAEELQEFCKSKNLTLSKLTEEQLKVLNFLMPVLSKFENLSYHVSYDIGDEDLGTAEYDLMVFNEIPRAVSYISVTTDGDILLMVVTVGNNPNYKMDWKTIETFDLNELITQFSMIEDLRKQISYIYKYKNGDEVKACQYTGYFYSYLEMYDCFRIVPSNIDYFANKDKHTITVQDIQLLLNYKDWIIHDQTTKQFSVLSNSEFTQTFSKI